MFLVQYDYGTFNFFHLSKEQLSEPLRYVNFSEIPLHEDYGKNDNKKLCSTVPEISC